MVSTDARLFRSIAAIALFIVVGGLAIILRETATPWQDGLGQASYDSLHRLTGQTWLEPSPVVVVYLDLASYQRQGLDPLKPWPRALHAQLLRRLTAERARAVIFDIVFSGAGPVAADDEAFARAIRENGRVVLAAECNYGSSHVTGDNQVRALTHSITPPADMLARAAASIGLAAQVIDDDYAVRRYIAGFSDSEPGLTWSAATLLKLQVTQQPHALSKANTCWLRYYGPPLSVPHVSYSEALDPAGVPANFFQDKIVLIGARPWVEQFHERQDEFANPYHAWSKKLFMPGVEVHATEMLNLLQGNLLKCLAAGTEALLLLLCAAILAGGLVWLRPMFGSFAALAAIAAVGGLACFGFNRGTWFPWLLISAVEIPCAWAGLMLAHSVEWYRARKRFEEAKRIADAKIREQAALIDKAHDAILVQDLHGRTVYANASAERLYGWTAQELQRDTTASEILLPDVEGARIAKQTALNQGEWNGELRQQTRQGHIVVVATRWTLIRDEAGQPKALLIMNTDVTDQKQLEAQLLRTQRMNTIGSLAGGMAHDLNNALAPILLGVQLLRRKNTEHDMAELLDLMETSTHRGADMVRQVLLFARGRTGDMERLDLAMVVRDLEKMVRETFPKNITVDSFLPPDLWPVRGNPTQLYQVLLNLCVNARDAMPNGGKLSFAADNVELPASEAETIPNGRPGKFVSLLVSDTGTGVSPEIREKIFEPFFTTKSEGKGTGIGLSTVLRIMKAHEGFLRVESEPGQGTMFDIFLPIASEAAPVTEKATRKLERGKGELLLIADDESAIRELLKAEFDSAGYRVLAAADGEEALALFRKNLGEVRLLITDGEMPKMDGRAVIAAIRKFKPGLPVILTSAASDPDSMTNIYQVAKPFAFEDILASAQQILASSKPTST
jgi:PAS domain S-box-containing protein